MTEETLLRVQQVVQTLNYRPGQVARSLVTSQIATIGLIVAEIYNLDDEKQAVNLLLEKRVDGLLFLSTSVYLDDDYLFRLPPSVPSMILINRPTTVSAYRPRIEWAGWARLIDGKRSAPTFYLGSRPTPVSCGRPFWGQNRPTGVGLLPPSERLPNFVIRRGKINNG